MSEQSVGGSRPVLGLHPRSFGKPLGVLMRAVMVPASQQAIPESGGGPQRETGLWHLDWGAGCGGGEVHGSGSGSEIKEGAGRGV